MATQTLISVEEFLATPYDGPEPDYFDGEVVERIMPTLDHGEASVNIVDEALRFGRPKGWSVVTDVRLQLSPDTFLIPDISIYASRPNRQIPDTPGLAAIEILSPNDRYSDVMRKLRALWNWGVPHVWAVDTEGRRLHVFDSAGYREVPRLEMPEHGLVLAPEQVFR
jgi:Uma2 family endonuclease